MRQFSVVGWSWVSNVHLVRQLTKDMDVSQKEDGSTLNVEKAKILLEDIKWLQQHE